MAERSENGRPSAIPRPSRLPVLSRRSSQHLSSSSQCSPTEEHPVQQPSSRLAKRSSIAVLPRADKEGKQTTTLPRFGSNGTRPGSAIGSRPETRTSSFRSSVSSAATRTRHTAVSSTWDEQLEEQASPGGSVTGQPQQDDEFDEVPGIGIAPSIAAPKRRLPRASLSDRAIESIQMVPTTPKDRRQSNFFNLVDSPMGPPPRPQSGFSNHDSVGSRPGTSDGTFVKPSALAIQRLPATAKPSTRSKNTGITSPATRRSVSSSLTSKLQSARTNGNSKPFTNGVTEHLVQQMSDKDDARSAGVEKPLSGAGSKRVPSDGSAALRQQIAAAKAAMKKEREKAASTVPDQEHDEITIDQLHADPFNQAPKDTKHVLTNRIRSARMDGKLNISALDLKEIPDEVLEMYSSAAIENSKVNWAEIVDLNRFIAADNEIEVIADNVFPDVSPEDVDEDSNHNLQFFGLEQLDLHGNSLTALPPGLRRLERLTSLNLAHNKLEHGSLNVIASIKTLKDLRLGHNSISGNLPASITSLASLEVLDIQSNRLLALPETIRDLSSLRVLNVSGNQLTSLPMQALSCLPLHELDASGNALIASLFPLGGQSEHKTLRTLNVANNSLAALTFSPELSLPELQSLDVTNNHLTILPSVSGLQNLINLRAGDNKIAELPEGFATMKNLRIANFSGNELHLLPPEIALMDSLSTLVLASNPLRHKKFLNMAAADIKHDLQALLSEPGHRREQSTDDFDDEAASWGTAPEDPTFGTSWSLKSGGVLDLSNRSLTDAINDSLGSFLKANEVRQLNLRGNKLTTIPPALWLGQDLRSLDLSGNPLNADYLSEDLELPSLTELDISTCRIPLLEPLLDHLRASNLQSLQISGNRVSGPVPVIRRTYPRLAVFLASDNKFQIVQPESIRGLTTVDLTSNELQSLPAELGLLWDDGLRSLEVGRNAFRVPGHRVLEKGTQALLTWLKHRIKVDQEEEA